MDDKRIRRECRFPQNSANRGTNTDQKPGSANIVRIVFSGGLPIRSDAWADDSSSVENMTAGFEY